MLVEGIVLVVVILFLFLGDLRSSVIVIATLILTPALTFLVMNQYGMSANLMSLGGLAIAIGLMVDGSVVVVENVFAKLGNARGPDRLRVIYESVMEVGTPVIFGSCIIILVFPSAHDIGGHGRKDVCAARLHNRDRARNLIDSFANAFARPVLVLAQGRP